MKNLKANSDSIGAKIKRQKRVRKKMKGTFDMPRLSVHRTNNHIYAQLINDKDAKTILGVSEKNIAGAKETKIERAKKLGLVLAGKALDLKIKKVIFDRGNFLYHGRIKAVADGAREGGLEF